MQYVDELKANFTLQGVNFQARIEINGTEFVDVNIDNVNVTNPDWIFIPPIGNRIDIGQANNLTVYFPQTPDTAFATHGKLLEGNFINTLPEIDNDYIIDLLEMFNPDSDNLNEVLIDLKTDSQKIYEVIGKLQAGGFYPVDSGLTNGTNIYFNHYNQSTSIQDFLNTIENEVRNATSGFSGEP